MQREEIRRKFDEIVDFAEIEKFLDTPVKRYSSGMYVRLAFAVAAHLEPEILIVDEVLAVGDVQFQKKCLGKMEKVGSEGRTILFVSHNLQAVTTLCNSSIWIDKGTICGCGNTNEIIKKYLTVSGPKKSSWFRQLTDVSKKASVKSIIVTNHEGQPAHDLSYEHPFSIDITYDFNVPISGVAAAIRLKTSDNVCVLVTSEKDSPNVDTMTQRDGQYHSRCYFPGKLFKPGTYIINVGLFREGVEVYDFHEDIVSFEINPEGCVFFDTRDGILMTPLNWQILDSFDV
jgi:lipopolysaccharide transport system ATP-binding protein